MPHCPSSLFGNVKVLGSLKIVPRPIYILLTDPMYRKTQIAIEECYRFLEIHAEAQIFWAHAGTLAKFMQACKSIAEKLRLPGWNDPTANAMQLVHHWLVNVQNRKWLFVLDNLDDLELLEEPLQSSSLQNNLRQWFSQLVNGAIIVTTRDRRVGERLAVRGKTTVVSTMPGPESVQLLRSYLPSSMDVAISDLEMLTNALDQLPLAITQAAAYITEQCISVREYFSLLQDGAEDVQELLSESHSDDRRIDQKSNSVIKTWRLSFDHITKQNPRAAEMLSMMAMFDRQSIPKILLIGKDESKRVFIQAAATLQNFSMITRDAHTDAYTMHRLVQWSTLAWLGIRNATVNWKRKALVVLTRQFFHGSASEALLVLARQFPNGDASDSWRFCEKLLPHARTILQYSLFSDDIGIDRAMLFYHVALFDASQARMPIAHFELEKAMEIFERLQGLESLETALIRLTYAKCLNHMLSTKEALKLLQRTRVSLLRILGPSHVNAILCSIEIAKALHWQGAYDEAEALQTKLLEFSERSLGLTHYVTLQNMTNLASIMISLEKYHEAEELQRRTLKVQTKVLGTEASDTLITSHRLAWNLFRQKKWDEAIEQYRLNMFTRQKVLGSEHYDYLRSREGIALCLCEQGKYEEAVENYRHIFEFWSSGSEEPHPLIFRSRVGYIRCLFRLERWEEALEQILLILSWKEATERFGSNFRARATKDMALCLEKLRGYDEAAEQYRIVLASKNEDLASPREETFVHEIEEGIARCNRQLHDCEMLK